MQRRAIYLEIVHRRTPTQQRSAITVLTERNLRRHPVITRFKPPVTRLCIPDSFSTSFASIHLIAAWSVQSML